MVCKQTLPVVEHVSLCFALIGAAKIVVSTSSRLTDPFPNGLFLYVYQSVSHSFSFHNLLHVSFNFVRCFCSHSRCFLILIVVSRTRRQIRVQVLWNEVEFLHTIDLTLLRR